MRESQDVEFKKNWRDEYMKTLCAFSNTNGGILYIGIDDDGNIVGVKKVKELLEKLPNKIRNSLGITPAIVLEGRDGEDVVKIEIGPSEIPVSFNGILYKIRFNNAGS